MRTSTSNISNDYVRGEHPDLPPPREMSGAVGWMRNNLFSSLPNTLATLISLLVLYWIGKGILTWAFLDADFVGQSARDCNSDGACWALVTTRWQQFMFGFYPTAELWRPILAFALLCFAVMPWLREDMAARRTAMKLSLLFPIIAFVLLAGGLGLEKVETSQWGGLMLTLVVGVSGITASLPLGILLALGRQSDLPVIKSLSVAFIELIRGVPLITVLFMASVMLPLFLPEGVTLDKLLRALIMVALFAAAYMAEVIRGGLQAIPKGQIEAAQALGLGYWRTMILIVLPQALRIVIPGIVNTFIGLFKDTTLVAIIGLFDLLGIAQNALTTTAWQGLFIEAAVFVAAVFWVFCFSMSRYSQKLEQRLKATAGH